MNQKRKPSIRDRLVAVYWLIVGMFGIGGPIVDRRSMYGDDATNDPYSIDYDPSRRQLPG